MKKGSDSNLEFVSAQAESYDLRLNTPYFYYTNGEKYDYYMRGNSHGKSLVLETSPPLLKEVFIKK
ncbi:hypothetical protein [Bacillus toyonensis]|uniref:hypothetical protein n=1 Tax=Bacillus toyonensis TaxID=155322 RepID=UPI0015D4C81A|nr:hypothetical protein [Bacillus toyonensis]